MEPSVRTLLRRLASDPAFAAAYFADPDGYLGSLGLDASLHDSLRNLDRDAVRWMYSAAQEEPPVEPEHPRSQPLSHWLTPALGLWVCFMYVVLWLLAGRGL